MAAVTNVADVTVRYLDVGQGDATLIIDHGTGKAMLIDCPAGRERAVEEALDRHQAELDVAVITHFDDDHSGGVVTLLETRYCRRLLTHFNLGRRTPTDMSQARRLLAMHKRSAVRIETLRRGDAGFLGGHPDRVRWLVLAPDPIEDLDSYTTESRNRASIVLKLDVFSTSSQASTARFIFGGDADGVVWRRLIDRGDDLACFGLLWPHHGGGLDRRRGSHLAQDLLAACSASVVVVSAGTRNPYGHPHPSTLAALRGSPTRVLCTEATRRCHRIDRGNSPLVCAGDVIVRIDGGGYISVSPTLTSHLAVVAGWDNAQCVGNQLGLAST